MTQKPAEEWQACQWTDETDRKYQQCNQYNIGEIHNPKLLCQQQNQSKNSMSYLKKKNMQKPNQGKKILHGWYSKNLRQ